MYYHCYHQLLDSFPILQHQFVSQEKYLESFHKFLSVAVTLQFHIYYSNNLRFDDKMIIKTCLKRIVNTYRTHVDYIKKELHWPKSGATPLFGSNWNQFLIFSGLNSESKTSFYPFNKFRQHLTMVKVQTVVGQLLGNDLKFLHPA